MESGGELVKKAIEESKSPMELVLLKKQFGDRLKEHVNADLPPGPRENTLLRWDFTGSGYASIYIIFRTSSNSHYFSIYYCQLMTFLYMIFQHISCKHKFKSLFFSMFDL